MMSKIDGRMPHLLSSKQYRLNRHQIVVRFPSSASALESTSQNLQQNKWYLEMADQPIRYYTQLTSPPSLSRQFMLWRSSCQFCPSIVRLYCRKFMIILLSILLVLRYIAVFRWVVVLLVFHSSHRGPKCGLCFCCACSCSLLLPASICPKCKCCYG
jgi:hypothetical protein